MTIAIERILAWKLLPRVMMAVMCYAYLDVLNWFKTLPPCHDIPSHRAYRDRDGCHDRCLCRLAGAWEV